MRLRDKNVGFALTGSHCTLGKIMPIIEELANEGANIFPILSKAVDETDTRFGSVQKWKDELIRITAKKPMTSVVEVEPIGPKNYLDVVVVAPCSGNTLAKLANGIIDTPVAMAVKAQLRNSKPVVLGVSTNDGLGINAKNIGVLLSTKNIYFIPFGQDDPIKKENSLVADFPRTIETIILAMQGKQIQPVVVEYKH